MPTALISPLPFLRALRAAGLALLFLAPPGATMLSPSRGMAAPAAEAETGTPEEVFAEMRKSFRPEVARGVHATYQFHFLPPYPGDWWIIVNDGAFRMGKGTIEHPEVHFTCTGADWVALSNDSLSGFRAVLTGRLKVKGSQSLARKLDEMFP